MKRVILCKSDTNRLDGSSMNPDNLIYPPKDISNWKLYTYDSNVIGKYSLEFFIDNVDFQKWSNKNPDFPGDIKFGIYQHKNGDLMLDIVPRYTTKPSLDVYKTIKKSDYDVMDDWDTVYSLLIEQYELKYSVKSTSKTSSKWGKIKDEIASTEDDVLDDDTTVSNYLNELIYKVTQSLNIELEGSAQAGEGVMTIYDSNMDEVLNEVDYSSFNYDIIDLAMESNNVSSFKKKVKEYLQNLI